MPETGYSRSPKLARGALVQLLDDVVGVLPNIVPFQYNPTEIQRVFRDWHQFQVGITQVFGVIHQLVRQFAVGQPAAVRVPPPRPQVNLIGGHRLGQRGGDRAVDRG